MDFQLIAVPFLCGYVIYRLGLPPLVGFLIAGLLLNFTGLESPPALSTFADLGITLLLFTIGLKLKIKNLLKPEILAGTPLHMLITVIIFCSIIMILSLTGLQFFNAMNLNTALLISFGLSFSSTVFAVKVLEETGRMESLHGKTAIGVLIIQDIIAVIYLTFSTGKLPSPWALSLIILIPIARKIFIFIIDRVGHGELQVLFGFFLALVAGATSFEALGLKSDLGALVAGMLVADHKRAKELADSLLSIKDLLLVGFFVEIGLTGLPSLSGLLASFIFVLLLPLKLGLYYLVFTRFHLKARTSFVTTLSLSNYSEFGLIVCSLAVSTGYLDQPWLVVIAISLSLSFIVASLMHRYGDHILQKIKPLLKKFESEKSHPEEQPYETDAWEIAVIGMGRIGTGAYDYFYKQFGNNVVGVDYDPKIVEKQIQIGRNVIHGDVTDDEYYQRFPKGKNHFQLIILATSKFEANMYIAKQLRQQKYTGTIAAVAKFDDEIQKLFDTGVDTAFNLYGEAGAGLAAHICESFDCNADILRKKNPGQNNSA